MRKKCLIVLASLFTLLFGCSSKNETYSRDFFTMDTVINITVYSNSEGEAKAALDAAEKEFFRISALSDRFSDKSDLSKVNKNAGKQAIKVSDDVFRMIDDSISWAKRTNGAFDIAVGPLMDLWGIEKGINIPPEKDKINEALKICGYQNVVINKKEKTVFLKQKDMILDLGGIAKGYATDCAATVLKKMGVKNAIINAGGNVYTIGGKTDGSPFRVGIQDPRNQQGILAVIPLSDKAAVSSGDYERYYIYNGVRYHHILDPATGFPARKCIATTIIGNSAEIADILSTSLFVMGPEKGLQFANSLTEIDGVLFVTEDKTITATSKIKEKLEMDKTSGYQLK
ncbi:MAG: FAD:protein FMN transferase [Clostridiales bacterium]|nr:FAD:protein FMN transferase [Clostridiales bacterium]